MFRYGFYFLENRNHLFYPINYIHFLLLKYKIMPPAMVTMEIMTNQKEKGWF